MPLPLVARCLPAFAVLLAAGMATAQAASPRLVAGVDPHTKGEPAAIAKLGYVGFGPFAFGTDHDTNDVEELLGTEPLAWIETAHFRIGCALSPVELRSDEPWGEEWIRGVRLELKRLHNKLPRIDPATPRLDPWLRAHLIAQRLEDLYTEVAANLGVDDRSFPVVTPDDPSNPETYRGSGPFLGMRAKYRVLLLRHESSHARYTRAFQHHEMKDPVRDHDFAFGSYYWGGSEDAADGLFRSDLALHAHVVFNVAYLLYSGYRDHAHDLPVWLATGLGHWHSRRVSQRFPTYERRHDGDREPRSEFWRWQDRIRSLAKEGCFEPLPTLCLRDEAGAFGLEQQIQAWGLVDWLMREQKSATMRFVHLLKEPFHARTRPPTPEDLRDRQWQAMREAFGVDAAELQRQWVRALLAR